MPSGGPRWLASWRDALLPCLLPGACALCGGRCDATLCAACETQFFQRQRARCRRCANPLKADYAALYCQRCDGATPAFDATLAACDYAPPLDQLVLQLKFGGRLALAALFARRLHEAARQQPGWIAPDLLCPVPLGAARLAGRGFNQALEIARPLARALGVALHPTLAARALETAAQSGLGPGERQHNMAHAFVVTASAAGVVRGRHIGVVDDVMSSGQTLGELAATLKRYGAARVTNLVFARTPPR